MRRLTTAIAATAIAFIMTAVGFATPAYAYTTAQTWDLGRINYERSLHHVASIPLNSTMTNRAQYWANYLAAHHILQDDSGGANTCFYTVHGHYYGTNAGEGGSYQAVEYAFEASSPHLSNEIYPYFKMVGIGIAVSGSTTWLVQDYCG